MKCARYRQYWLGELTEAEWSAHRADCSECRTALEIDEVIEGAAADLPVPTSAPGLWERIADDLEQESRAGSPRSVGRRNALISLDVLRGHGVWKLAAMLVAAIGLTTVLVLRRPAIEVPTPRNLLTEQALDRIEAVENEYAAAIAELEAVVEPVITAADGELLLRYRSRLETIDTQIRRCQAILARDGANAHVRRYLLAAYRDKQETLIAILNSAAG